MERKVIIAATKSNPECSASESTPRLPVLTTRKVFSETRIAAEPTLRSAARFFSRASSIGATISIAGLDYLRFYVFLWVTKRCYGIKNVAVISLPSSAEEAATAAALLRRVRRELPLRRRGATAQPAKPASRV